MRQARRHLYNLQKMRIRTFILCLFLCVASAFAKDVITKTDGSKIDAKVEEITETVIKYRKATNPTGPVYTIPLTSVATIRYENGDIDSFNAPVSSSAAIEAKPTSPSDDELMRLADSQSYNQQSGNMSDSQLLKMATNKSASEKLYLKASKYRKIGWIGGATFVVLGPLIGYYIDWDGDPAPLAWGGAGIGLVVGASWCLGFNMKANSLVKQARQMESYSFSLIENEIMQIGDNSLTAGINLMGNRITHSQSLGLSLGLTF